MNYSYKRYWEPSTAEVLGLSLSVNAISTALTYPIEFIKVRSQIRTEGVGIRSKNLYMGINPHKVFREIHATGNGLRGFYQGFESHLIGRLSYLFIRNLTYKIIYDRTKPVKAHNDLSHKEKGVIAGFAGGLAAFLTSPADLVNTRTIAEGGKPKEWRWGYKGLMDGINKIAATEGGNAALFRGSYANVLRAVILNISLTGPFDYLNEKIWITFGDMTWNKYAALLWAAFWGSVATLPFDNIRTRLYAQNADPTKNRLTYSGWADAAKKLIQHEGISGFYVGFYAFYLRTFLYAWTTVFLTDKITSDWKRKAGLKEWQI
ncbi:hypothetical protein ABPG72_015281 [Tetrahymena utriculariae]